MAKLFAGRDRDEGDHRRHPGARRLRLHQGVRGGALLPRRQDHPDLRGHLPDPEAGHRPASCSPASPGRRPRERRPMADGKERWERRLRAVRRARRRSAPCPYETLSGIPCSRSTRRRIWRAGATRTSSATRASSRTPAGRIRRCTAGGSGRCGCSPGSAGRRTPTPASSTSSQQGQTGLSTAFDMPALMGYDADHPRARGEVGREGVSISTLADFEILFRDIPLDQVTTSMTINCTASVALAMYLALADKQGVSLGQARRHHAERHAQGVHRPEGVDLAARVRGADGGRHHRVLRPARAALQPGVDLRLPHPRGGLDRGAGAGLHPGRRLRLRARPRSSAASTSTTSPRACRSSSTSTTTSSRRSPSCGRRGGSGPP